MKKLHFLLFLFICTFTQAQLDVDYFQKLQTERVISTDDLEWTQFGPASSGYNEFFWCHPTDPNIIHTAPDMFNGYRSADGGKSWQTYLDYDGHPKDMSRTYDIEFSRQNPNLGFATDELGGLFKTINKGKTWTKTSFSLNKAHGEISVDPSDDNNWYIGSGTFWDVKRNHRTKINKLGEQRPSSVTGHIYISKNKGNTWTKITNGLPNTLSVCKILVNPKNSNQVIMAANTGVYKSSNGGNSWSPSNTGLPNNAPKDIAYHYNKNSNTYTLYLIEQTSYEKSGNTYTSTGGIFKSNNGGTSWSSITGDLAIDLTKITNSGTRDRYKRTVAHWLGLNKGDISNNYPATILPTFNRIVINPKNPQEIYISQNVKHDFSFGPGDVWKTTNGGTNWFPCARTGKYWLNNTNNTYWTNTRNNTDTDVNTKFAHLQHDMDIRDEIWGCRFLSINSNGDLFVSLDQQILKSTNGGNNWKQIDDVESSNGSEIWTGTGASNLPGRMMLLETGVPGRKLFCSGEHGLWKSAPSGSSQRPIAVTQIEGQVNPGGAHSTGAVAVHPNNPNIIYTVQIRQNHRDEFRESRDGGQTWSNKGTIIDYPNTNLSSDVMHWGHILIDKNAPKNIYTCLIQNPVQEVGGAIKLTHNKFGVYKSTNDGKNWSLANNGIPNGSSVRRLTMDPKNSKVLYACLNTGRGGVKGGLYISEDGAENWRKINTLPNDINFVNNLFIDKNTDDFYIACGSFTSKAKEGGVWKSTNRGITWSKIFEMPQVWQIESSPKNSDILIATVGRHKSFLNGGIYISKNKGLNWIKATKNIANSDRVTDIKPDPDNENIFWCAGLGSGWYRAVLKGEDIIPPPPTPTEPNTFYIVNRSTGKKLSLGDNNNNGASLIQVPVSNNTDHSKWTSIETNDGYFYLKNVATQMYFRPQEQSDGSTLIQRPQSYSGNFTQWKKVNTNNDYFYLENKATQMYFRPENNNNNSLIIQRPKTYSGNYTQWKFENTNSTLTPSIANRNVLIHPNPVLDNYFNVELDNNEINYSISIYNYNGQLKFHQSYQNKNIRIPTENLDKGLYIIEIKSEKETIIKKLIKN